MELREVRRGEEGEDFVCAYMRRWGLSVRLVHQNMCIHPSQRMNHYYNLIPTVITIVMEGTRTSHLSITNQARALIVVVCVQHNISSFNCIG